MFNLSGSELIFLVIIALVVLGPDKLPEAMRKAGKLYNDFKKMTGGFQDEMRNVLEEPLREFRETADMVKGAAMFDPNVVAPTPALNPADEIRPKDPLGDNAPPEIERSPGPNFASAAPRPTHPMVPFESVVISGGESTDAVAPDVESVTVTPVAVASEHHAEDNAEDNADSHTDVAAESTAGVVSYYSPGDASALDVTVDEAPSA